METLTPTPVQTPITNDIIAINAEQVHRLVEIVIFKQRHLMTNILKRTLSEISLTQFILLELLSARESLSMGQLAKFMGHTTPATTGLIERLVTANLVERATMPTDRRQILIKITPRGAALVSQAKQEMIQAMCAVATKLTPEDQQAWYRINEVIHQYLNPDGLRREQRSDKEEMAPVAAWAGV
ncbi:MAG: MarR family transcriptional regulator [Verrucomicrobiales bacterium]|jgi:DNA-binding MarR family transcriptional regulator|nr:MarR family transcriptional regulator [Verrucomicrobiales bacterium]